MFSQRTPLRITTDTVFFGIPQAPSGFGRRLTDQARFPSPAEPPIGTFYQSAGARSVQAGTRGAKRRGGEALTGRVTADIHLDAMGGGVGEGMP